MATLFRDRAEAGRQLGAFLAQREWPNPIVLGMARGGVVVAAEVARALEADLDVVVVRKIGAPHNPEFGIGAVAPNGAPVFDPHSLSALGLTPADLDAAVAKESEETKRRLAAYRPGRPPLEVADRTAILVDDGLATGITALAAARYVRALGPRSLIFAAPVCSQPGSKLLEQEVDEVVCLAAPADFYAVGAWYEDFAQTSDAEVLDAQRRSHGATRESARSPGS